MNFGSAWELSDIDLWNIDLLDTHLDLLDTDIPSKYFVSFHSAFKTSSRHVFNTSSRYVFKTSSRRLQRNNVSSSKTSSRRLARCLQYVFKTSSRRLQDVFKTFLQDVFKTSWKTYTLKTRWRRLEDQKMFAGTFFLYSFRFQLYWTDF